MTNKQRSALGSAVRASHGYCLDMGGTIANWCAQTGVDANEACRVAPSFSVPFPSIRGRKEGPFPVKPEAPYWDGRFHENAERGAMIVDACGHERSA